MANIQVAFGLLTVLLVLAACDSANGPPGGLRIEGIEWRAESVGGVAPPADHVPTLTITGEQIKGSTGCNSYGGTVRVDGNRLVVGSIQSTLRACLDERANDVERRFLTILGSSPEIGTREGRLILTGTGGEIVLESPGIFAGPSD